MTSPCYEKKNWLEGRVTWTYCHGEIWLWDGETWTCHHEHFAWRPEWQEKLITSVQTSWRVIRMKWSSHEKNWLGGSLTGTCHYQKIWLQAQVTQTVTSISAFRRGLLPISINNWLWNVLYMSRDWRSVGSREDPISILAILILAAMTNSTD